MKNTFKINTKKRNTFIIATLIMVLAVAGILAGCNNKEKDKVVNNSTNSTVEESVEPTTEPTSVPTTEPTKEPESTVAPTEEPTSTPESTEAPTEKPEVPESTEAPTEKPVVPETPVHTHNWSEATCTSAKKCECGETSGTALGHNFGDNNKTCSRCGIANPNYVAPHSHDYATTVTNPTCTTGGYTTYTCACGHTYTGNNTPATGHNFVNGDCHCGAHDPNYVPPHTHSWNIIEWVEKVFSHTEVTPYYECDCNLHWYSGEELRAHQAATPLCNGYRNGNDYTDIYVDVTHHRRECACGATENID